MCFVFLFFCYCEYTYYFRLPKICSLIVTWFSMVLSKAHLFCKVRTFWESQNGIEISHLQPIIESSKGGFFPESAIHFSNIPKNYPLLFLAWNWNEASLFQSKLLKFSTHVCMYMGLNESFFYWELILHISVMRVGSDTFGDPIFQKGLQN